jgi:hypothetical protein
VIVMSVRANLLSQSLPHYAAAGGGSGSRGLVSKVIVAWNNPDAEPPLDLEPKPDPAAAAAGHAAPRVVWVRMPTSSMNNRYALYDHVETECVVTVDDDLLIPHRATRAAFEAWRGDLFQQVVGHAHYARYHFDRGGEWAYGHDSSTRGWSLALAGGGAVYHRALLRQYASPRFAAGRALVDATRNCEDILLNVVATGLTGRGPAVVDALTWPERHAAQIGRAGGEEHLSQRPSHYSQRDECLQVLRLEHGDGALVHTLSLIGNASEPLAVRGAPEAAAAASREGYRSSPPADGTWTARPLRRDIWLP